MRSFGFDHLLSEVNKVIGKPSDEDIRVSLLHQVRYVFSRIGYELVCELADSIEIELKEGKWKIPSNIVKVVDVSFQEDDLRGAGYKIKPGQQLRKSLAYYETPFELKFPNLRNQNLFATAYRFYEDEAGNMMIPEDAYKACYDWGIYEGVNVLNNPKHPRWQERPIMYQIANASIYESRGLFNEHTTADFRTNRYLR